MTKQAFVDMVAARTGLSRRDAARAVEAFLDTLTETLRRGDSVSFTGFGRFSTRHRATRQGVNPRDPSRRIQIPAAVVPKFAAGGALKSAVRASSLGADSEGEPDEPWERRRDDGSSQMEG
jgi:DNA-binding protein HU-beta